jgi:hypothetical protein
MIKNFLSNTDSDALFAVESVEVPASVARRRPNGAGGAIVRQVTGHERCPLLFLDVDGPLLPFGRSGPSERGDMNDVAHLSRLRVDAGPRLAALPCTLVWATTWLEDANTEIAPRLGLPGLAVVTWPEPTLAQEREDQWLGLCWKTRTVVDWAAGRPFAWVDDEITDADREWVSGSHPAPAMLRSVDSSRGLTDRDFDVLGAWLGQLA